MREHSVDAVTSETSIESPQTSTTVSLPHFTPAKFAKLCDNEYSRYEPNSDVIAHAVIRHNQPTTQLSGQFPLPDELFESSGVPMVGHLTDIKKISLDNGKSTLFGQVGKTTMLSRRSYEIHIDRNDAEAEIYTFHTFSPKKNSKTQQDRSFFYDTSKVQRFNNTEEAEAVIAEHAPQNRKTSDKLVIFNEHVKERIKVKYRKPDQNTVMGRHHHDKELRRRQQRHRKATRNTNAQLNLTPPTGRKNRSAVNEMADFVNEYENVLTDDMIRLLNESANAPLNQTPAGQARAEWLHRHSHNLHPLHIDPQHENNLGAASKRYNTEMMILERTVQFFALNIPQATCKIHAEFDMLLDSEIIDKIDFSVFIQLAGIKIQLIQHIDTFQKEPQNVKSSDLASLVGILHHLIQKSEPRSIQPVTPASTTANITSFSGNFFSNRVEEIDEDEDDADIALLLGNQPK